MNITSRAFTNGGEIPAEFTGDGSNYNPPLTFSDIPTETQSLVLIVDDPDAPGGTFDHWLVYNIDPSVTEIAPEQSPTGGIILTNGFGTQTYGGPHPPTGQTHRYFFRVYALDIILESFTINDKPSLLAAMEDHILAQAELIGTYVRK